MATGLHKSGKKKAIALKKIREKIVRVGGKMDGAHYRTVCDGKLLTGAELHLQPRHVKQQSSELVEVSHSVRRAEPGSDWGQHSSLLLFSSGKNVSVNHLDWAALHTPRSHIESCIAEKRQHVIHQASQLICLSKLCLWVTGVRVSHDK